MPTADNSRPFAIITGASAGIGAALAKVYASENYDVLLIARRQEKLIQLAEELETQYDVNAQIFTCDLSKTDAADKISAFVNLQNRPVDVLVNNAGFGLAPEFTNTSWEEQSAFLQLMLSTPCQLVHTLLPAMKKRGKGSIVNIASMAGYAPAGRGHTLYAASKAALIKFSQSLFMENRKYGLNIVAVCPGLTYSEFHDVNGQRDKLNSLPKYLWQSADQVALASFKAGNKASPVCIPGIVNKVLYVLNKILPETLSIQILKARHK